MEIALAILGSGALSALVSGLFTLAAARRKKKDGVRDGMRVILYDRIKYLGRKYIEAGAVDAEDLEDIMEMHRIYHDDLGGNGFLDSVMAQVRRLPLHR